MARKLTFGRTPPPPPINFDKWRPTKGQATMIWLPDNEFDVLAKKYGIGKDKDAFTVWGQWWQPKKMIFRATHIHSLVLHEVEHVERKNFHKNRKVNYLGGTES